MNQEVALNKLKHICSGQEKSPADIMALLRKWDVPEDDRQQILQSLKDEKYLDETRFAIAYTSDKIRFDHWGLVKIRLMLQQKGISNETIEEAFNEIDRSEYRSMIGHEISKKRKSVKGAPYEIWAKLARYGASRGYAFDDMREFLGDQGE
ncbi:MAG TPA: regulatory protein RecX [Bacteroidales bacterium]|nr:regulatory protein RecX [Bacteroidales bacterium]